MGSLGMEVKIETSDLPPDFKYKESTELLKTVSKTTRGNGLN